MSEPKPSAVRMGRPLGFARKASIESAMNLFWEQGFVAVSNKHLAEAMGIQRSSFYNSFGSKEAVFKEALECYGAIAPDRLLDSIQEGTPVLPAITSFFRELCSVRSQDPGARGCLVCNSLAELAAEGSDASEMLERLLHSRTQRMQALFDQARRQGETLPDIDSETMAHAFVTFLIGLNVISKVVRDERSLWSICELYMDGLQPSE